MKWLLRKLYCWKHKIALDQQRIAINKHYKKDPAYTVGKPIYQGQAEARDIFDSYFQNYHFHKNFFTNYHAVWKLFCSGTKPVIPENFFVYDIACGPYTATLSLLQFFENEKTLKRQAFFLNLCDMGDFTLEKLYQANSHIQPSLVFPVPLENECKEFQPGKWEICTHNCYYENTYGCRLLNNIQDTRADIVFDNKNSMNLIFCSYAGISYNSKFIDCISNTIANFSPAQKTFPTYIIFSHYTGEEYIKEDIKKIPNLKIKSVIGNNGVSVPFSTYYYYIFETEAVT